MYQVFGYQHRIFIAPLPINHAIKGNVFILSEPSTECMAFVLDYLEKETFASNIFLLSEEPERLWESWCSLFELVPAAGGVVRNEKGEYLLIFRNGKWDLPKGKLEEGEDIATAALREVEEECGISGLELGALMSKTHHIYPHKGKMVLKETAWFEMTTAYQGELVPQTEEGIEQVAWFAPAALDQAIANTYSSLEEIFQRLKS